MINTPKIYKIRIVFTVAGVWDHKHIMAVLREMVLASGLPFEPAKINKHWPRLAYGPALGYRQHSLGEWADLYFSAPVSQTEAQDRLTASAPDGVCVLRVRRVPYALPSVSQLAEVVQYSAQGDFLAYHPTRTAEEFFNAAHIYVAKEAPNGMKIQRDVSPFIYSVTQPQPQQLKLLLQKQGDQWTKPEEIVAAWLQIAVPAGAEFALPGITFTREALFWRDSNQKLHAL